MVEVFKTNVKDKGQAEMLLSLIHRNFGQYRANFDLEDCDRILRVKSREGKVHPLFLIELLKDIGYQAEVLPDIPFYHEGIRERNQSVHFGNFKSFFCFGKRG